MPSTLSEIEIFDCLYDNVKLAADCADKLAVESLKGDTYQRFIDAIELIEGACKQVATHREDARWLPLGIKMGEMHQKAGDLLRGYKIDGEWIKIAPGELNQNFIEIGKHLRHLLTVVEKTRNAATGKVGMIVPKPVMPFMREAGERQHRVQGGPHLTPGGIIVPSGVSIH